MSITKENKPVHNVVTKFIHPWSMRVWRIWTKSKFITVLKHWESFPGIKQIDTKTCNNLRLRIIWSTLLFRASYIQQLRTVFWVNSMTKPMLKVGVPKISYLQEPSSIISAASSLLIFLYVPSFRNLSWEDIAERNRDLKLPDCQHQMYYKRS